MRDHLEKPAHQNKAIQEGENYSPGLTNASTFQFSDNRPEAKIQQQFRATANNSPQVKQLSAIQNAVNSSPRLQGKMPFYTVDLNSSLPSQRKRKEDKASIQMKGDGSPFTKEGLPKRGKAQMPPVIQRAKVKKFHGTHVDILKYLLVNFRKKTASFWAGGRKLKLRRLEDYLHSEILPRFDDPNGPDVTTLKNIDRVVVTKIMGVHRGSGATRKILLGGWYEQFHKALSELVVEKEQFNDVDSSESELSDDSTTTDMDTAAGPYTNLDFGSLPGQVNSEEEGIRRSPLRRRPANKSSKRNRNGNHPLSIFT